jgi:hypothetical protein
MPGTLPGCMYVQLPACRQSPRAQRYDGPVWGTVWAGVGTSMCLYAHRHGGPHRHTQVANLQLQNDSLRCYVGMSARASM